MSRENHYLRIGRAHKPGQTNTPSFVGRILGLRTKAMLWVQFYSKAEFVEKDPLYFCNNTFSILSSDLYLVHYLLFLNRSIPLSSVPNPSPCLSLQAITDGQSVSSNFALWRSAFPTASAKQLYPTILLAPQTCHLAPKRSPVPKIHTSSFHTRQLWAFNPGSNHLGDPGMLRGRTQIQSGKHYSQCSAKYQIQFIIYIYIFRESM